MTERHKIYRGIYIICALAASVFGFFVQPVVASKNEFLNNINHFRLENGRAPLKFNLCLTQAAKQHALSMLRDDFFDHVSPSGSTLRSRVQQTGYNWRFLGENLTAGISLPHEVLHSWINSKSHRKILLKREFIHAGIFHLYAANDGGKVIFKDYWVLVLASPVEKD